MAEQQQTKGPAPAPRRVDGLLVALVGGAVLVGAVAMAASASTLAALGYAVGWTQWDGRMAWALPVSVDALALVAGAVWLSQRVSKRAQDLARTVTLIAVFGSVVLNSVGHLVESRDVTINPAWRIGVSTVPPLTAAVVIHLVGVVITTYRSAPARAAKESTVPAGRRRRRADSATSAQEPERRPAPTPAPEVPTQPRREQQEVLARPVPERSRVTPATVPVPTPAVPERATPAPAVEPAVTPTFTPEPKPAPTLTPEPKPAPTLTPEPKPAPTLTPEPRPHAMPPADAARLHQAQQEALRRRMQDDRTGAVAGQPEQPVSTPLDAAPAAAPPAQEQAPAPARPAARSHAATSASSPRVRAWIEDDIEAGPVFPAEPTEDDVRALTDEQARELTTDLTDEQVSDRIKYAHRLGWPTRVAAKWCGKSHVTVAKIYRELSNAA
ncbi:DUF2637 domain-containing protein [Streptomyces platensis]|uniref:DUF2637 domain-containing protein n=1 Tax=Streptomyces platensis TaxID=58346 RepID=UPI0036891181